MTKKEIVERIKEIEKRRIDEGYLKGPISGYFKITERRSKRILLEFTKVMLKEEVRCG